MENKTKAELCQRQYQALLPRLSDYPDHWAKRNPSGLAFIEYSTGEQVTWKDFALRVKAFAAKLHAMGLQRGDVVATTLPLIKEHVYLMWACFRLGIIVAPLDLRLKEEEVDRSFRKAKPKAYFFLGKTQVADFRKMVQSLMGKHQGTVKHWIQFQKEKDEVLPGAIGITEFAADIQRTYLLSLLTGGARRAAKRVDKRDPAVIVFTTGSTGEPKPALLSHESILVQCIGLTVAFEATAQDRMLINLPPSHVGCLTEQLTTIIYAGGTGILLPIFKADETLDAIQKYRATMLGQIPAQYNMEWRLSDYAKSDLSSLRMAIYGGQAVSAEFLNKLSKMTQRIGTGLGLTETAGFCTYTPIDATAEDINLGLGFASPLCPISIRKPMEADGKAGAIVAPGEVGEICFSGPQVFSGYLHDEENTRKTLSMDGIVYTGDVGSYDDKGLHLSGRRKQIIKPKGYQVFPGEVENFIATKLGDRVSSVAVVGVPHEVFSEAILAYVEVRDGQSVTAKDVSAAARGLASYARPSRVEIVPAGSLPLNRVGKTDYLILKERGEALVKELRSRGEWDAHAPTGEG